MQVNVKLKGVDSAKRKLARQAKKIDPVLRGALNTTATKTRTERFVKPLNKTLAGKRVRSGMKVKRARRGMMNSRIIPSSAGVPVVMYKNWGMSDPISPTRARIWVAGPNGHKTAAGFINPASAGKLPLATRSQRGKYRYDYENLQLAHGPSLAYWFKDLAGPATIAWANQFLKEEFERRAQKELNK